MNPGFRETQPYISPLDHIADTLDREVGPYYGDILKAAEKFFHQFENLRNMQVIFDPTSPDMVGGLGGENYDIPMVHMGTAGDLHPRIRSRLIARLDLPSDANSASDEIFRRLIFAHEVGHVIQSDPMFETYFGEIDGSTYDPSAGYSQYVNSDQEMNADFIAHVIVGASELGRELEITEPGIPLSDWRNWAATRYIS